MSLLCMQDVGGELGGAAGPIGGPRNHQAPVGPDQAHGALASSYRGRRFCTTLHVSHVLLLSLLRFSGEEKVFLERSGLPNPPLGTPQGFVHFTFTIDILD